MCIYCIKLEKTKFSNGVRDYTEGLKINQQIQMLSKNSNEIGINLNIIEIHKIAPV